MTVGLGIIIIGFVVIVVVVVVVVVVVAAAAAGAFCVRCPSALLASARFGGGPTTSDKPNRAKQPSELSPKSVHLGERRVAQKVTPCKFRTQRMFSVRIS